MHPRPRANIEPILNNRSSLVCTLTIYSPCSLLVHTPGTVSVSELACRPEPTYTSERDTGYLAGRPGAGPGGDPRPADRQPPSTDTVRRSGNVTAGVVCVCLVMGRCIGV